MRKIRSLPPTLRSASAMLLLLLISALATSCSTVQSTPSPNQFTIADCPRVSAPPEVMIAPVYLDNFSKKVTDFYSKVQTALEPLPLKSEPSKQP